MTEQKCPFTEQDVKIITDKLDNLEKLVKDILDEAVDLRYSRHFRDVNSARLRDNSNWRLRRPTITTMDHTVKIMFIGMSGSGKSITINTIPSMLNCTKYSDCCDNVKLINDIKFSYLFDKKVNNSVSRTNSYSQTVYGCTEYEFSLNHQKFIILDTPAWSADDPDDRRNTFDNINNFLKEHEYLTAIVLVEDESSVHCAENLKYIYGTFMNEFRNSITDNIVLLITRGEDNTSQKSINDIENVTTDLPYLKKDSFFTLENIWLKRALVKKYQDNLRYEDSFFEKEFIQAKKSFFQLLNRCKEMPFYYVKDEHF